MLRSRRAAIKEALSAGWGVEVMAITAISAAVGGFAYAVCLIGPALAFNAGGIANSFPDTGIYPAAAGIINEAPGAAAMGIKSAFFGSQRLLPFFLGSSG